MRKKQVRGVARSVRRTSGGASWANGAGWSSGDTILIMGVLPAELVKASSNLQESIEMFNMRYGQNRKGVAPTSTSKSRNQGKSLTRQLARSNSPFPAEAKQCTQLEDM